MWQLLLTTAIATSTSLLYFRLTQKPHDPPHYSSFNSPLPSIQPQNDSQVETTEDHEQRNGIFAFSSSGSGEARKKKKKKNGDFLSRKSGIYCRRLKYGSNAENDCNLSKRRRKRGASASSKERYSFNWGLGAGIMYMMSAGKSEIKKLSNAMDETSKVVQELRAEIYQRKFGQVGSSSKRVTRDGEVVGNGGAKIGVDDIDCPSSVLTDEPEAGVMEMDQMEAELESELLKLPWCDDEDSRKEVLQANEAKDMVLCERLHEKQDEEASISYQSQGVAPSELDKKLCHLLIEQQENQIVELESELNSAQSKLREKEAELEALKDCVRRLTEFSISTVSDDETNVKMDQEGTSSERDNMQYDMRKSVVGMKRPMSSQ